MLNIYNQGNLPDEDMSPKVKKAEAPAKPADFRTYVDPTGELRSKELGRGIWLVSHRVWIYRLIILVLVLLNVFLWLTGLIKWGIFFIGQSQTETLQQLSRFPSYVATNKRLAPEEIQIFDPVLLPGGVDKYDVIAEVTNPNNRFVVQFEYRFLINGSSTEKGKATILPNETRPIAILGLKGYEVGEIVPVVEKIRWTRLNAHTVADPHAYQAERLNFVAFDFVYTPASLGSGASANTLTFDILNNSPFNYVEPQFYVGLYNGPDNLVGLAPLTIKGFDSLTIYHADIRNFVRNLQVSEIKLFPMINVYDKEVYRVSTP